MGMKIVMIGPYPLEPGVVHGGIESVTSVLVPALAQREDVEWITVLRFHDGEASVDLRREGPKVEVHYLRGQRWLRTATGSFLDLRKARKLVAQVKPDVVHGQELGLSGHIALRCSPNTAITVHGVLMSSVSANTSAGVHLREVLRDNLMRRMQRSVLRRAKVVISISKWDAEVLDLPIQGTREYIPNPIGAEFFALAPSDFTRPRVLFAGVFNSKKNPVGLINAFARVRMSVPEAHLSLVGPQPDPDYMRCVKGCVKDLGLEDCVAITGLVGTERMQQEIAAARAVVLFSREENSPTILAQAMAAGKPVVASRVGGVADMVDDGETGFLVESDDEAALADRMVKLLADQDLSLRLGKRAHEIAVKRFAAAAVAERTMAAYRKAVS